MTGLARFGERALGELGCRGEVGARRGHRRRIGHQVERRHGQRLGAVDHGGVALVGRGVAREFGIVDDDAGGRDAEHGMDRRHAVADIAHVGRTGIARRQILHRKNSRPREIAFFS